MTHRKYQNSSLASSPALCSSVSPVLQHQHLGEDCQIRGEMSQTLQIQTQGGVAESLMEAAGPGKDTAHCSQHSSEEAQLRGAFFAGQCHKTGPVVYISGQL